MGPSEIIFCEGAPLTSGSRRNTEFDARVYRAIFSQGHPDTEFISLGGSNDVEKDAVLISAAIGPVLTGIKMARLIDRDDRSEQEITTLKATGVRVLSRRNLESYLWDNEVLAKLCEKKGKAELIDGVFAYKKKLLEDSVKKGNPHDNYKDIKGPLYVEIKNKLTLTQCGNSAEAFSSSTLAPLITEDMTIYKKLEESVFGNN